MIDSENDTAVPPKELRAPDNSRWDLVIPAALFVFVAGLLFLAFQPQDHASPRTLRISLAEVSTQDLSGQAWTIQVATELLRRNDASFETAESCVRRLAVLQGKSISEICAEQIQRLPNETSHAIQQRWVRLISKYNPAGIERSKSHSDVANRILLASNLSRSPTSFSSAFQKAASAQQRHSVVRAVSLIPDRMASEICLRELRQQIILPACNVPEAVDPGLLVFAIDSVAAMNASDQQKSAVFCELAVHGICRAACFRQLSRQSPRLISDSERGYVAAAVLGFLAIQSRLRTTRQDPQIQLFAERLAGVFRGRDRERYEKRLGELQHQSQAQVRGAAMTSDKRVAHP